MLNGAFVMISGSLKKVLAHTSFHTDDIEAFIASLYVFSFFLFIVICPPVISITLLCDVPDIFKLWEAGTVLLQNILPSL